MLIDSHSHIHFDKNFPDQEAVIKRADAAGVKGQILVGCNIKDSDCALKFVKQYRQRMPDYGLWSTLGVHPHDSNQLTDGVLMDFEKLVEEENREKRTIVAIGEIGLDYNRNFQSEDIQKNAFKAQLELAKKLDLPVVIHERDAWEDTMQILGESGVQKVVLHSFTGGLKEAQECIDRGYYLSFSGMLTYPKNEHLRDVTRIVPLDKFFVETDCPYLPPQQYRGQRNEPANVVEVAKEFAKVNEMEYEEVAGHVLDNTADFFKIEF